MLFDSVQGAFPCLVSIFAARDTEDTTPGSYIQQILMIRVKNKSPLNSLTKYPYYVYKMVKLATAI